MIVGDDGCRNLPVVGDEIDGPLNGRRKAGGFLLDLENDAVPSTDPRLDLKGDAHLVSLDGLEWIYHAGTSSCAGRGISVLPREKGNPLPHLDSGLLVIERHDAGCGQNIGVGVGRQGVEKRGKAEAVTDNPSDTKKKPVGNVD